MGHCNYQNGDLARNDPIDHMSIENIGLATRHLQYGYTSIWSKKERLKKEIIEINDKISNVINEFQQIIVSSIPSVFRAREDIVETNPEYMPVYVQRHTFAYLFDQINRKLKGIPIPQLLIQKENLHLRKLDGTVIPIETFCLFMGVPLAFGDKAQLEDFKTTSDRLILNEQLVEVVQKYRNWKTKLSQLGIEEYYADIDNLWREIYENGNTLEGKGVCRYCPKHSFLDYF